MRVLQYSAKQDLDLLHKALYYILLNKYFFKDTEEKFPGYWYCFVIHKPNYQSTEG